jgi:hypothetical protein
MTPPASPATSSSFERQIYLSRKTGFPVFAADAGDAWLQVLNLTLKIGAERPDNRGEPLAEAQNVVVTVGLPVIAEDLEVEVAAPEEFPSYLPFTQDDLERRCESLRTDAACDRLKASLEAQPDAPVLLTLPDLDRDPAPGLASATFNVSGGELFGSFVFVATDVYGDWPLQAMALIALQRDAAARLDLAPGAATFVLQSARLSARDWERTQRLLDEAFQRPLPLQVDHSGIFLFGNDGGKARAMLLDHDAGSIYWEAAFDTPQQLSWYIVDAMPWLLPQHIRYVGQECSTLERAIRDGACYEQG